ncbi:HNH endonuclease signature motif containing protein [Allokutzneria albata]|uniref:DUF222 domain-containing protein n=1 Tax=Allokutzneria albata TaxID=211114 RepID=A0A1G9TR57_ALLAB|nr:HNH endonuclease signature motif containing protein [Allokutzneria albata]SDM49904.1 protein of unknown function [Allokutzneria albata]
MAPADIEDDVVAAYAAIGKAVAEFASTLMKLYDDLDPEVQQYAGDVLMPLLRVSQVKGNKLVDRAMSLVEHPVVLEALAEGRLDEGKALMIIDQVSVLDAANQAIAKPVLINHAATHNYTASQRYARRFILKLDAEAALRRHEEKRKQRLVEKFNLDDGMCSLRVVLPALDAALAFDRIDRIARALPKDDRTLDQKRSDVAADLLMGKDTPAPQGEVCVNLTMPITNILGLTKDPVMLAGYGPLPAPIVADVAANGIWKRILTDPVTGMAEHITTYRPTVAQRELINARYPTCTMVGCNQPAHRCDLDHCCPFDGTNTTIANLRPKCRHHHRMKTHSNWSCENRPDGTHAWTTPSGKVIETELEPIAEPAPF